MKAMFNSRFIYAVALSLAAASGGMIAFASVAKAQSAGQGVQLSSAAKIERLEVAADGSEKTVLKTPKEVVVVPGDRVVFTLTYTNKGAQPASGFKATNPMPGAIQFLEANENWAEVSADGGKNWGKLGELSVTERIEKEAQYDAETGAKLSDASSSDETRLVQAKDVTHVRWVFSKAIAPGETGTLSYRGVVK